LRLHLAGTGLTAISGNQLPVLADPGLTLAGNGAWIFSSGLLPLRITAVWFREVSALLQLPMWLPSILQEQFPVMRVRLRPSPVCEGQTATYFIAAVAGAASYAWTVPAGTVIIGRSDTAVITLRFDTPGTGNISVAPVNGCGVGGSSTKAIVINPTLLSILLPTRLSVPVRIIHSPSVPAIRLEQLIHGPTACLVLCQVELICLHPNRRYFLYGSS
jgi:hypothetical protein